MRLLQVLAIAALAGSCFGAEPPATIRGKLEMSEGKPSVLEVAGKPVLLDGDGPTRSVLHDRRLAGTDFEVVGHYTDPGHFRVDPIENRAMFFYKAGKRYRITYWCDVCAIRTYSPGPCICCQQETQLDPRDPDEKE